MGLEQENITNLYDEQKIIRINYDYILNLVVGLKFLKAANM